MLPLCNLNQLAQVEFQIMLNTKSKLLLILGYWIVSVVSNICINKFIYLGTSRICRKKSYIVYTAWTGNLFVHQVQTGECLCQSLEPKRRYCHVWITPYKVICRLHKLAVCCIDQQVCVRYILLGINSSGDFLVAVIPGHQLIKSHSC